MLPASRPPREGWRLCVAEGGALPSVGVEVPGKRAAWALGWYWCGVMRPVAEEEEAEEGLWLGR
jgi:hypothetical protein